MPALRCHVDQKTGNSSRLTEGSNIVRVVAIAPRSAALHVRVHMGRQNLFDDEIDHLRIRDRAPVARTLASFGAPSAISSVRAAPTAPSQLGAFDFGQRAHQKAWK